MGSLGSPLNLPHFHFSEKTTQPGTAAWCETCNAVRRALEEYGFFLVTYDKLTLDIHDSAFTALRELFDGVPTETKMKNRYEKPLNGYVGQIPKLPLHESMGIDGATLFKDTQKFTDVMWPEGNDCFWLFSCLLWLAFYPTRLCNFSVKFVLLWLAIQYIRMRSLLGSWTGSCRWWYSRAMVWRRSTMTRTLDQRLTFSGLSRIEHLGEMSLI